MGWLPVSVPWVLHLPGTGGWSGHVLFLMRYKRGTPNMPDLPNLGWIWLSVTPTHIALAVAGHICYCPVTQSCLTLCNPMDCSTLGHTVHHQFPESTQTHIHPVGDAIQPSHPLSSLSPPTFNLSKHQGLF